MRKGEVGRGFDAEIGLDDLRRHVLLVCVVGCVVTPLVLMAIFSRPDGTPGWLVWVVLALYAEGILALLASRLSTLAGAATLLIGLLALATGSLWVQPLAWLVDLVPLVVLLTSAFFDVRGGLLAGVAISLDLLLVRGLGGPLASEDLRVVLVLIWASVPVAWLGSEPIRLALRWSWEELRRAEADADRARGQQAQLARLVKSLNVAQDRFEQLNHEMERARRAADEARRIKAEFAATISHELRTPLNLIIGFSELLVADGDGAESRATVTLQRDVDTIYRNARHLSSLIDDILDLAQIDAARLGLAREPVDLAALAREAAAVVQPLLTRKGLSLTIDLSDDLPPASIDRARVRQVLINLMSNAARFTDVGGVRVRACRDGQQVQGSVSDTGGGISPEDLPTVFEEFHQLAGPTGRRAGHSGLGLTISKRLIELHGGSMWVESRLGQGTTFFFTLPLCDTVVSAPLRREWETWARASGNALDPRPVIAVFDDDPEPAHLLQRYLDGYDVIGARTIAEVRRVRQERGIAAVALTGPTEPAMWQTAQRLRSQFSQLPVLLCPLPGRRRLAQELGVVDYLVKPILRDEIARLIRRSGRAARDVLVIDDDPDMVDLLVRMIQSTSRRTTVRSAYGGADGLAALRERRPDLVLLDLLMPSFDGYALLEQIRADVDLRDVPVVVVTARGRQEEMVTAGMLGITRGAGLSIAQLTRLLKLSADVLSEPVPSNAPAPPADLPES
ncbi:MAG: ATP-binding protein [Chloroflexota bacterium]